MSSSDNTNFLIISILIIIFIALSLMIILTCYLNFGDYIKNGILYFFLKEDIPELSDLVDGKLIQSYIIPNNDLVTLGRNNVGSAGVQIGLRTNPPINYYISGPTYPFHFKASDKFSDSVIDVFKSDNFKKITMKYVVKYRIAKSKSSSLSNYSPNAFFAPYTNIGGSTFNDIDYKNKIFNDGKDLMYYGQSCILKKNNELAKRKNIFIILGVIFNVTSDIYKNNDINTLNGTIYKLTEIESITSTPEMFTNSSNPPGYLLPYNFKDAITPNSPFDINRFFPTVMQYYSEKNGFLNYSNLNDIETSSIQPFTIFNSYLLIPEENKFSGAIADFAVKTGVIPATSDIKLIQADAEILN